MIPHAIRGLTAVILARRVMATAVMLSSSIDIVFLVRAGLLCLLTDRYSSNTFTKLAVEDEK